MLMPILARKLRALDCGRHPGRGDSLAAKNLQWQFPRGQPLTQVQAAIGCVQQHGPAGGTALPLVNVATTGLGKILGKSEHCAVVSSLKQSLLWCFTHRRDNVFAPQEALRVFKNMNDYGA
jgi:hypothetical protein